MKTGFNDSRSGLKPEFSVEQAAPVYRHIDE
jgi:hypothetical protein